jgi:hypothetical protein
MSGKAYWSPTINLDKSRGLRNLEGARHVRAGGRTCSTLLTGIWICSDFLESWVQRSFFDVALNQLTQCIPLDSTELLRHK